ncbi:DnaJ domain-containing protein [Caldicellulosiruptoraceae bacterium PP1]
MRDPYEVLGLQKGATKEEIKKAYLEMVKKYHPDKYKDNPLKDLAEEKLKEINEAYNILMNEAGNSYTSYTYNNPSNYQLIRDLILKGNLVDAERLLLQNRNEDAEWYYLMGLIYQRKGWVNEAYKYYQAAYMKEPSNFEYKRAKEQYESYSKNYEWSAWNKGYNNRGQDCDMCSICQIIAFWECCCDNDCGC